MLLLRTPRPFPTESFAGYLIRVTEANGYDSISTILDLSGNSVRWKGGWRIDSASLETILNIEPGGLVPITNIRKNGSGGACLLGQDLSWAHLAGSTPRICPQCVQDTGFIEAHWDLALMVACPHHRRMAVFTCWSCGDALSLYRPKLLECHCGADLTKPPVMPADDNFLNLLAILRAVALNESPSEGSKCGLPVADLSNMSLRSLTTILAGLGGRSLAVSGEGANGRALDTVVHATAVLSRWPEGFRQLLRKMAANRHFGESAQSASNFRAFYQSLFGSLFKRKLPPAEVKFLRKALVEFGVDEWTRGLVDSRLLRNASVDRKHYQAISHVAKDLEISMWLARRMVRDGLIALASTDAGENAASIAHTAARPVFKKGKGRTLGIRAAAASLGIPVSVLRGLREAGHYQVAHIARPRKGFHELDLKAFNDRFLGIVGPSSSPATISLGRALQTAKFGCDAGKLDLMVAFLDGKVIPIGRSGENVGGILLDLGEVKALQAEILSRGSSGIVGAVEAGKRIGCSEIVISSLVRQGFLEVVNRKAWLRIREESVAAFTAQFIATVEVAHQEKVSPQFLVNECREAGIELITAMTLAGRPIRYFVRRTDLNKLCFPLAIRALKERKSPNPQGPRLDAKWVLSEYFDRLRRNGEPLPRRRHTPNKRDIAKACGLDRSCFYTIPEAAALLDAFDHEDRERTAVEKLDNVGILRRYLAQLSESDTPLPRSWDGKPNRRAVAAACGFHRNVLYTEVMSTILNEYSAAETVKINAAA